MAGLLTSTPTSVTGAIDPSVLLDRLEAVSEASRGHLARTRARCGRTTCSRPCWPAVPLPVHPVLVEQARAIDSAAGRQAAAWFVAGGGELPRVQRLVRHLPGQNGKGEYNGDWVRLTVELVPTVPAQDAPADSSADLGESAEPLALTTLLGIGRPACHQSHWLRCWPTVLPAHRDLIAGFALAAIHSPALTLLPELAAADGQLSDGFGVLLANGLTSQNAADRVGAVDAAMVLIGRGQLDADGLAQNLAALSTGKETVLARAVPALREIAEAGGAREVRDVIAAMLPAALPPTAPKVPRGNGRPACAHGGYRRNQPGLTARSPSSPHSHRKAVPQASNAPQRRLRRTVVCGRQADRNGKPVGGPSRRGRRVSAGGSRSTSRSKGYPADHRRAASAAGPRRVRRSL